MGDEHLAVAIDSLESRDRRKIAATHGVDGLHTGIGFKGFQDEPLVGGVDAVAVADLDDGPPRAAQRRPESDLALTFATKYRAAERDEDTRG